MQLVNNLDTFGQGFTKFNENTNESFVSFMYLNGQLICTRFDGSTININLPLDQSNKILTEVGTVTIGSVTTIHITPLSYQYNSNIFNITGTSSVTFAQNGNINFDRIDIIFVNTDTNVIERRIGTPALIPSMPVLQDYEILVAAIYRTKNYGSIEIIYSCFDSQMNEINIEKGKIINKLSDLKDVNISSLSDNQVLTYDSALNVWKNETPSNGIIDYVRSNPVTVTVGGFESGETPNFTDIREALDKILYKIYDPVINLSSLDPFYEAGEFVNIEVFYNISTTLSSATPSNRDLFWNSDLVLEPTNNSGSYIANGATYQNAISHGVYDTHQFQFEVDYFNFATQYFTLDVNFIAPTFFGSLINSNVNPTNILTLTKNIFQRTDERELIFNPDFNRIVYAYPSSFGDLTDIKDINNFSVLNMFDLTVLNIVMIDLSSKPYNVYTLKSDTTQIDYKLKFIF